jgi:hypothetical protein
MKRTFSVLVAAAAALVCLAFAGSSAASHAQTMRHARFMSYATTPPSLTVEQSSYKLGASPIVDFFIFSDPANEATAKMSIFSPNGYSTNISQAPGTTLGQAVAFVKAGALGGSILPLAGPVVVGNPSDSTIMAQSQQCTGHAANQAVWILDTQLQGQRVTVPDFVNKVGPYLQQQICLTPPATSPFQAQLVSADFNVAGVFTNASAAGTYQWAADFTPYAGTTPNPAGTLEWRTALGLPASLTLKQAKPKGKTAKFSGKLSLGINGLGLAGLILHEYAGKKARPAPTATSGGTGVCLRLCRKGATVKASGGYTFSLPFKTIRSKKKPIKYIQTRFENYGLAGDNPCIGASPTGLPIPCKGEDLAPISSNQVKVKLPKPKRR